MEKTGRVSVYGINLDIGKAVLRPESEAVLAALLKLLNANPDWKILIEGHTDNVGAKAANRTLSTQRAQAVRTWLVGKGIAAARLTALGLGDTKPVAANTTDEGRARNRRVDLVKQ